jgi:peroxiredoxin
MDLKRGGFKMRGFKLSPVWGLCLLLVAFASTTAFSDGFDDLEIGDTAPDFTLRDLAEKEFTLSDSQGDVVVIQFGSSTTVPFVEQIKSMNDVVKKYKRQGVTFITVYTVEQMFDWQASDYFEKYERAKGLRFQLGVQSGQRMGARVLVDDTDETVYKTYGSVPAGVFIVDKDENLAYKARVVNASDVDKTLEKLM